jgi:hypothetical protein
MAGDKGMHSQTVQSLVWTALPLSQSRFGDGFRSNCNWCPCLRGSNMVRMNKSLSPGRWSVVLRGSVTPFLEGSVPLISMLSVLSFLDFKVGAR